MATTCPSCAASSPDDARFCIACGGALPATGAAGARGDASPALAPGGFSVRWMLLSLVFLVASMVAVAIVLGVVAVLLDLDLDDEGLMLLIGSAGAILGLFGGGFVTGWRSPGVTVREPVVAIVLVVVAMNLASGNVAGAAVGWMLPAVLAYLGARLGERLQRSRVR